MSMRLCWWPATEGGRVELHRDAVFLTRHVYPDGSVSTVLVDTMRAQEHYEYAQAVGHVDGPWPFPSRRAT